MRKVLKFIALLPFRIMSIPVIVALFVLQWIGIFLVSMSSWIFNLVATIMFTVSLIGLCMGGITKMECLKYLAVAFAVFIVPFLGEGLIMVILEIRLKISDWLWQKIKLRKPKFMWKFFTFS